MATVTNIIKGQVLVLVTVDITFITFLQITKLEDKLGTMLMSHFYIAKLVIFAFSKDVTHFCYIQPTP